MSFFPVMTVLPHVLVAVLFLVGAALMATRLTGAPRTCGVTGCVLLAVLSLWSAMYGFIMPRVISWSDFRPTMLGAIALVTTLMHGAGYALLIAAAVLRRRPEPAEVPFGAYGYGGGGPGTGPAAGGGGPVMGG